MDDEAVVIESAASAEVQAKAEAEGWIPPARFKGDAERFVDAEEYLRRGEEVLPIVKKHNERLKGELAATNARLAEMQESLKTAQAALDGIEERHSAETARKVAEAKADLRASLQAASEAGDHAAVAEITEKMTELNATPAEPAKKEEKKEAKVPTAAEIHPDFPAWMEANPKFGRDRKWTAMAQAVAVELREGGETAVGRAFFDKVALQTNKELGLTHQPPGDKTEGGKHNTGGDTGSRGKGYNSLPADAKKECDAGIPRFVGPNKKYKDEASYRANWAAIYHGQD